MNSSAVTTDGNRLFNEIKNIIITSRKNIVRNVNTEMLSAYWNIGKLIIEDEQKNNARAQYGEQTLKNLSKQLTKELGNGFSLTNLKNMRKFFLVYKKGQTLSDQLSWSHYCELLSISDYCKRSFYEKECIASRWSVRELKRQLDSSLYERLLLTRGKENKKEVKRLAEKGQEIEKPEDILKDPYVFEFAGLPENRPVMEADLENALISHIEKFLLELGKGFMFVGRQQRISFDNEHYYADMVFYNKILRAYVIIELKTRKLLPAAAGQLNMYLNYYKAEINDADDNDPIGIILCTDKPSAKIEYVLGGLENRIFASKYVLYLPDRKTMEEEVQTFIESWEKQDRKEN